MINCYRSWSSWSSTQSVAPYIKYYIIPRTKSCPRTEKQINARKPDEQWHEDEKNIYQASWINNQGNDGHVWQVKKIKIGKPITPSNYMLKLITSCSNLLILQSMIDMFIIFGAEMELHIQIDEQLQGTAQKILL